MPSLLDIPHDAFHLVACSAAKSRYSPKARDLYTGSVFSVRGGYVTSFCGRWFEGFFANIEDAKSAFYGAKRAEEDRRSALCGR